MPKFKLDFHEIKKSTLISYSKDFQSKPSTGDYFLNVIFNNFSLSLMYTRFSLLLLLLPRKLVGKNIKLALSS